MAKNSFDALDDILKQYVANVDKDMDSVMSSVSREAQQQLADTSPKDKGEYASGWRVEKTKNGYTVYNEHASLTHLLEKGHDVVAYGKKVGHVKAQPHIKKVNDWVAQEVYRRLEEKL